MGGEEGGLALAECRSNLTSLASPHTHLMGRGVRVVKLIRLASRVREMTTLAFRVAALQLARLLFRTNEG